MVPTVTSSAVKAVPAPTKERLGLGRVNTHHGRTNRGKESLVLDIKAPADKALLDRSLSLATGG